MKIKENKCGQNCSLQGLKVTSKMICFPRELSVDHLFFNLFIPPLFTLHGLMETKVCWSVWIYEAERLHVVNMKSEKRGGLFKHADTGVILRKPHIQHPVIETNDDLWLSRKRWRARTSWCRGSWASPKSPWWEWMRRPKTWSRSGHLPPWRGGQRRPRASHW